MEQICNERRLFRGSLLGWGAGGTQWGVCYFSPSRAIAHKLTSFQCKCLFSAKILNSILVLEKMQDDLSIAYAALQSLHLFKLTFALETNPKQLEEFSPRQRPHLTRSPWAALGRNRVSLLSCAWEISGVFKPLSPGLTLFCWWYDKLPVFHGGRWKSMLLRTSPYIDHICESCFWPRKTKTWRTRLWKRSSESGPCSG